MPNRLTIRDVVATLDTTKAKEPRDSDFRPEAYEWGEIIATDPTDGALFTALTWRIGWAPSAAVKRAVVRVHVPFAALTAELRAVFPQGLHLCSTGAAGGGGYCRSSGALDDALHRMGWRFQKPDGRLASYHATGLERIKAEAFPAIIEALGLADPILIT